MNKNNNNNNNNTINTINNNTINTVNNNTLIKELFAGTVGGMCQVLAGQPFDTLKVRIQTQPHLYSNLSTAIKLTLSQEGFSALYKGTLPPLLGVGACVGVQFGSLELGKSFFNHYNNTTTTTPTTTHSSSSSSSNSSLHGYQLYLSGAFSGVANSILSGPIEHIRTRLQVQQQSSSSSSSSRPSSFTHPSHNPTTTVYFNGPMHMTQSIYKQYGLRGLFKGQAITIAREFQGYGSYFLAYESLMQYEMKYNNLSHRSQVDTWKQALCGAIAGYCFWLSCYPLVIYIYIYIYNFLLF